MSTAFENIGKVVHHYLKKDFEILSWDNLAPYYEELANREVSSLQELTQWLEDRSELESATQENLAWRYIRMSCDTSNEKYSEDFSFFVKEIEPKIAPQDNILNEKFLASPFSNQLKNTDYNNYLRSVKQRVEIFRDENIPLIAELQDKQQQFSATSGAQTVEHNGQELTLQQASALLRDTDRNLRESVYKKVTARRLQDKEKLDALYTELIQLRNKIALNADFKNYRDYAFASLNRFDYTAEDCFEFHRSISSEIIPLTIRIDEIRKQKLGYDTLKPWDTAVDPTGKAPVRPYNNAEELVTKTIECLTEIDPQLADCIKLLESLNRLDLESRKGKAPGGYNYPLYETGVPFIFMNSTGQLRDLVTMVHESGHAVHSVLTHNLPFYELKSCPSEVAELASMSMELITMEHWHHFIKDEKELTRAKVEHLTGIIEILPWIATVDAFQHWVYENPTHTVAEREENWKRIYEKFASPVIDWKGFENVKANIWQKQIHIFDSPFYYIEYGMAQLGALAVWKNYKQDPAKCIADYKAALSLGYTKSIGEIYKTAGAKFDFSAAYIRELTQFLSAEIEKLNA